MQHNERNIITITILIGIFSVFAIALITQGTITGMASADINELRVAPAYDVLLGETIIELSYPTDDQELFKLLVTVNAPTENFYVYDTGYYTLKGKAEPFGIQATTDAISEWGVPWIKGDAAAELVLKKEDHQKGGYIYVYTCRQYTREQLNGIGGEQEQKLLNEYFEGRSESYLCGFKEFTDEIVHELWRVKAFSIPGTTPPPEVESNRQIQETIEADQSEIVLELNGPTTLRREERAEYRGAIFNTTSQHECKFMGIETTCNFKKDLIFSGAGTYPVTFTADEQKKTIQVTVTDELTTRNDNGCVIIPEHLMSAELQLAARGSSISICEPESELAKLSETDTGTTQAERRCSDGEIYLNGACTMPKAFEIIYSKFRDGNPEPSFSWDLPVYGRVYVGDQPIEGCAELKGSNSCASIAWTPMPSVDWSKEGEFLRATLDFSYAKGQTITTYFRNPESGEQGSVDAQILSHSITDLGTNVGGSLTTNLRNHEVLSESGPPGENHRLCRAGSVVNEPICTHEPAAFGRQYLIKCVEDEEGKLDMIMLDNCVSNGGKCWPDDPRKKNPGPECVPLEWYPYCIKGDNFCTPGEQKCRLYGIAMITPVDEYHYNIFECKAEQPSYYDPQYNAQPLICPDSKVISSCTNGQGCNDEDNPQKAYCYG